jgi:lipopolysaccharide export system protein LptA
LCLAAVRAGAQQTTAPAAGTNPTVITSDRLEYDYPRSMAIFTGNVVVEDKDLRMWADQMTVLFSPTEDIESVTAIGHVRIEQAGREATCGKAIFLLDRNEVVLTGDAVLKRGKDRVEGRIIQIWTDSNRMISEPGRLVAFPKDGA